MTLVCVVGTGTEIGKTHAGLALLAAARRLHLSVSGLKPVESGVDPAHPSDGARLAAAGRPPLGSPPYRFPLPLSPHLAAQASGTTIELETIRRWIDAQPSPHRLVETAGGLLSPLTRSLTNLDLVLALRPTALVLVAPDRLGVLHDLRACVLALRHEGPGLPPPRVLLQPPATPDASTGTNAAEILALGIADAVLRLPRASAEDCAEAALSLAGELFAEPLR